MSETRTSAFPVKLRHYPAELLIIEDRTPIATLLVCLDAACCFIVLENGPSCCCWHLKTTCSLSSRVSFLREQLQQAWSAFSSETTFAPLPSHDDDNHRGRTSSSQALRLDVDTTKFDPIAATRLNGDIKSPTNESDAYE